VTVPLRNDVLTVSKAVALQSILRAAQQNLPVRWVDAHGKIQDGEARSLARTSVYRVGGEAFNHLLPTDDVRDAYLEVWYAYGVAFIPVRALFRMVTDGTFVVDPQPSTGGTK
jgi:hypothetical protein